MFRAAFFFFPPRGWVPFLGIPKSKEDMEIAVPMHNSVRRKKGRGGVLEGSQNSG